MSARGEPPSVRPRWQEIADQGLSEALAEAWRSVGSVPARVRACGRILLVVLAHRQEFFQAQRSRSSTAVVSEALAETLAESQRAGPAQEAPTLEDTPQDDGPADRAPAELPPVDVIDFLDRVREKERSERARLDDRWKTHRSRERRLFGVLLAFGIVTAGLLVLGVALALSGLRAVGVVTAVCALLPGGGTLILRLLWASESTAGRDLERAQREHADMLDAVEFTLSLPADQRTPQAADLARRLQQRAFEAADRR